MPTWRQVRSGARVMTGQVRSGARVMSGQVRSGARVMAGQVRPDALFMAGQVRSGARVMAGQVRSDALFMAGQVRSGVCLLTVKDAPTTRAMLRPEVRSTGRHSTGGVNYACLCSSPTNKRHIQQINWKQVIICHQLYPEHLLTLIQLIRNET